MFKKTLLAFACAAILVIPTVSHAAVVDDLRAQIQSLLRTVASLQQQLSTIQTTTNTYTPIATTTYAGAGVCPVLSRNLWLGMSGQDVVELQQYLHSAGVYTYPAYTGYYGIVTQQAVQTWQTRHSVANASMPGYGQVGPRTRANIQQQCAGTGVTPSTPVAPTAAPADCRVWDDGCNICSRSYAGGPLACTQRACFAAGTPKCNVYFNEQNTGPTIHSVSGPTTLERNETGTWSVNASDSNNGVLSYNIDWGENRGWFVDALAALPLSSFTQQATFTHAYATAGTYTVTITVRNAVLGKETQTTTTVRVADTLINSGTLSATPVFGDAPLSMLFRANVGGYTPYTYTLDYGDGSARQQVDCYAPADYCLAPATVSHTYTTSGTYTVRLYQSPRTSNASPTVVDSLSITVGSSNPVVCTMEYAPVCGVLNNTYTTYGNQCQLNAAHATYVQSGECTAAADTVNVAVNAPAGGYVLGNDVAITWTTTVRSADVGMYLVLEDASTGTAIKSTQVNYQNGSAVMSTNTMCNSFFSDGIDASCSSLRNNISRGDVQYRVRAALFTPANACFGFCAPSSNITPRVLDDDFSNTFVIR